MHTCTPAHLHTSHLTPSAPAQDVDDLAREREALLQTCVDQARMLQSLQAACEALQAGSREVVAEAKEKVRRGAGRPPRTGRAPLRLMLPRRAPAHLPLTRPVL